MSTPPLPAGYALDATPPLPAGYALDSGAPAEQPSTYSKLTAPLNQNAEEWAAQHPVIGPAVRLLDAAGGAAISTPEGILNALSHPVDTAKATGSGIAAWFDPKTRPTWEQIKSVLPEALGQGVGNVAGGEAIGPVAGLAKDAAGAVIPSAETIAKAARTETGALRPGVKTAAKAAGAGLGATVGGGWGALVGEHLGTGLAESVIPDRLDAATKAERRAIPVSKNPNPGGYTGPAAAKAAAKAAAEAEASPIITTQSPDIPSEGRPATWRNLSVSDLASKGGPLTFDAAKQAQLRQLGIPDVGLVADPRATIGGDAIGSSADRLARLREIAGYPSLKGGPGDFASQAAEPKYLYRIRPVGEKGVPAAAANSPAQLTTSLEQAESWAPSKNEEGPHEIVRIPTSSLKPGQTSARPFSPEIDWHKALQAIPESDVEVVRPHQAEVESE